MLRALAWSLAGALLVASDWKVAVPSYEWSFPRDHWKHDGYRSEWWYFTGHLQSKGEPERRFGYQFTFFRIGVVPEPPALDSAWSSTSFVMGHAAVSDLDARRHVFSEVLFREVPFLASFSEFPTRRIGWSRGPPGTSASWTLDWNGEGFDFAAGDDASGLRFTLSTRPAKPLVFQGPNGFSRKGYEEGAASQYYSFTRLETSGELDLDGETFSVSGTSWMDKEFGSSQLGERQVGWDWFSLQLEDGRDLMLYLMRREDGSVDLASGTLVEEDGSAVHLSREDYDVDVLDRWRSPETGATYPTRWRVRLPARNLDLEVLALFEDQENRSRLPGGVHYWEGAVGIRDEEGADLGDGFVELTGYGDDNRPPV